MKLYIAGPWGLRYEIRNWMDIAERVGLEVACDWTSGHLTAEDELRSVASSDALLLALAPHNWSDAKGAWVEVGAALALGKPVFICDYSGFTQEKELPRKYDPIYLHHQGVTILKARYGEVEQAMEEISG